MSCFFDKSFGEIFKPRSFLIIVPVRGFEWLDSGFTDRFGFGRVVTMSMSSELAARRYVPFSLSICPVYQQ
jgi:hypothetical protein